MERFRLNTPYPMRLNTLSTPFVQQSRLDPNTQMRVITDPLLNMSYRRQFEDYQQNIFTETLGRVEGATIGAALGASIGTIIGAVASFLLPDFGLLIPAGTAAGAAAAGTTGAGAVTGAAALAGSFVNVAGKTALAISGGVIGGTAGFAHADYTTHHATMDIINNTIIASFKQNPAMGVLNSLAFTGKSMDLLMGGEAIRATISAAITGNNMFENIARAYGTHEDGRTEYDFSVLREQMGLDLGAFGNFVFDMTGEIVTDPGAWGGITGKLLTRGKAGKAIVESINTVNDANKIVTKKALSNPKLMKQLSRAFRHGDTDEILSTMKNVVDKRMTKKINKDVLEKFIKEVQDDAIKDVSVRAYKMFSQIDELDDFLTAKIFRASNAPIGAWHTIKKGKQLLNEKWLYNLAPDNKLARVIADTMDFVLGNKDKKNFIFEGVKSARQYISDKYNANKAFSKEGSLNDFIDNILDIPEEEKVAFKKAIKDKDLELDSPELSKIKDEYIAYRDSVLAKLKDQELANSIRVSQISTDVTSLDKKMEKIMKNRKFRIELSSDERVKYKKLYDKRKALLKEYKEIASQEQANIWHRRAITRTTKDKHFSRVLGDIQKLAALTRGKTPGEEKHLKKMLKELVELINNSEGEQYLDEIYFAYRNQPTFLDFLRKNIDDDVTKKLKNMYEETNKNYIKDLENLSPKYRESILKDEIINLDRLLTDSNADAFKKLKNDIGEVFKKETSKPENSSKTTIELYNNEEVFRKVMGLLNDFKNKYLYSSITDDKFVLKSDYAKQIEHTLNNQIKELNKQSRFISLLTNTPLKKEQNFGVYFSKHKDTLDRLTEQFRESFSRVFEIMNDTSISNSDDIELKSSVDILNSVIGSYTQVCSSISRTYKTLGIARKNLLKLGNIDLAKRYDSFSKMQSELMALYKGSRLNEFVKSNVLFSKVSNKQYFSKKSIHNLINQLTSFKTVDTKRAIVYDSIIDELNTILNNKHARFSKDDYSLFDYIDPTFFRAGRFETLDDLKVYAFETIAEGFHPHLKSTLDETSRMIEKSFRDLEKSNLDNAIKKKFKNYLRELDSFVSQSMYTPMEELVGSNLSDFIKTFDKKLSEFQRKQTQFAIADMKANLSSITKTYDDLLASQKKTRDKFRAELNKFLKGRVSDEILKLEGEDLLNQLASELKVSTNDLMKFSQVSDYIDYYRMVLTTEDIVISINKSDADLKQLVKSVSEYNEVSLDDFGYSVVDDVLFFSNNSLSSISSALTNDGLDHTDILRNLYNLNSRNAIALETFKGSGDDLLEKLINQTFEVTDILNKLLSGEQGFDANDLYGELKNKLDILKKNRNLAKNIKKVKNIFDLDYKVKIENGLFVLDFPEKISSEYATFIKDKLLGVNPETPSKTKLYQLYSITQDFIDNEIASKANAKADPENIKKIQELFRRDATLFNGQIFDSLFEHDYTYELTSNHIIKHLRRENLSNKDFANKTIKDFRYVVVDTETVNSYNGLLSISYREFYYKDGELISGKKKTMYLNPSEIRDDWEFDDEVDTQNQKILQSLGVKREFSKGATKELQEYYANKFGSFSMKDMLRALNDELSKDNTIAIMHNAKFDIKQLLNAKYELDNGKHLFDNSDAFELNNDFDSLFRQSGYDWDVIDTLDIVNKYGVIDTDELTNTGLGKAGLGYEIIFKDESGKEISKEIIGDPKGKVITQIHQKGVEEPEILFDGRPLHDAEVDTELTEAWVDIIFKKLKDVSIGEFNESIYTEHKYIDQLLDNSKHTITPKTKKHLVQKTDDYVNYLRNVEATKLMDRILKIEGLQETNPDEFLKQKHKLPALEKELKELQQIIDEYNIEKGRLSNRLKDFFEHLKNKINKQKLEDLNRISQEYYFTPKQVSFKEYFNKVLSEFKNNSDNHIDEDFSNMLDSANLNTNEGIRKVMPFISEWLDRYESIPDNLQDLKQLSNDYEILLQKAHAQKMINFSMTRQNNIAYRQMNTAEVNYRLIDSFRTNTYFHDLKEILSGKFNKFQATNSKLRLAKLFDENSSDELIQKFNSLPEIQKIRETFKDIEESVNWFDGLVKDIGTLSPNFHAHYSVVCQLLNNIDKLIKDRVAGLGMDITRWSDDMLKEFMGDVKSEVSRLFEIYRNTTDMTFGNIMPIYDRIISRTEEMVRQGKLPYLQPTSKFTNDFYNLLNTNFLTPLKDADGMFKNAGGNLEYTDDVKYLQELLSGAAVHIRRVLADVKAHNKVLKTNPININGISNKMVIDLSVGDHKIQKALRPVELPLYSKYTLVYSDIDRFSKSHMSMEEIINSSTKESIKLKSAWNSILSPFYKDIDIFNETTTPITNWNSNKTARLFHKLASSIGYSDSYLVRMLKNSNINLDEPLSELNKNLLENILNGNFDVVLSEEMFKALGEERLLQLREVASEILSMNEHEYKAFKPEKIPQVQNLFARVMFDNLLVETKPHRSAAYYAYNNALEEVEATKEVWTQLKQFFRRQDGSIDTKDLRQYFSKNKHEYLVYIDPKTGFLQRLNTDNENLLKSVLAQGNKIDVSVMSEDSFLKYASQHQRREFKNPVLKFLRDAVLRNIKLVSLTFSLPFMVTNALAATIQDITSTEGSMNVVTFAKNFGQAINEYSLWKKPYEQIGSSYLAYYYRNTHQADKGYKDWADFIDHKDFKEFVERLKNDPSDFTGAVIADKSADVIKEEAERISKLLESYDKKDFKKIKEFNQYMRTASVSGQSAEFNNRARINESKKKNLEKYKEIYEKIDDSDMRFFIFNDKPNTPEAIIKMGFNNKEVEIPEFKDISEEYKWLVSQKKGLNNDLIHRRNQLAKEIDTSKKEFYAAWLDKTKLPKMFLDFNGDIEVVFRTTMLKTMIEEGASLDEAASEVIRKHFLYTDKSLGEQMAEFIIPFISYPLRSINLFDDMIDDSSFMKMVYLWDKYSWGDAEEQRKKSDYLTSRKAKGDIPVGNVLLKGTNPFTEALMIPADLGGSFKNKLNPIIRTATGISPVTQLPGVSLASNLIQGIQDMSTGNYTPGQITGLANSFYRNSQYFYSKQPFTTKVKPFYNNLYTSGGFSRIAMNMQPATLKNVQYRVGNILYKRSIM